MKIAFFVLASTLACGARAAVAEEPEPPQLAPSPRLGLGVVGGVAVSDGEPFPYLAARPQALWGRRTPGTFGYGIHLLGGYMGSTRGKAVVGGGFDLSVPLGPRVVFEPSVGAHHASVRSHEGDLLVSTGFMIGTRLEVPLFVLFRADNLVAGLRLEAWWDAGTGELHAVTTSIQFDSLILIVGATGLLGVIAFAL